ncbi:MAG: bifunctional (p)ppGpp synthetase/guanosine-3',5'-bis(diphosphate) 3'-pyrophosphohydrolase [Bacteroidales bacterium]|nr:bifunctional (p)ppGpp synthetase/guanosine-3',5'-bis(diphosphate) 3'-pyrophosphohydrolase [Bacteroidales bacterium]
MKINSITDKDQRKVIRHQYKLLATSCKHITSKQDRKLIRQAFLDGIEIFADQLRENGDPYFIHSVSVAGIVAEEMELDTTSIIAALLEDVPLLDNEKMPDIEKKYGKRVAAIISNLHRITALRLNKVSINSENFIQLLLTMSTDIRVILIRLADRLNLMRIIDLLPQSQQLQVSSETSGLYAPLAHRLGLYRIKNELEELAMKHSYPEIFNRISIKIEENKEEQQKYFQQFISPIQDVLKSNGLDFEIKYRTKSIPSIWNKMKKQNIDFEQVFDFFAIRIITKSALEDEKSDCWKSYSLVTNIYPPNPSRLRDWISAPKTNGYESLHTTVHGPKDKWIEVQIRSARMDEAAEKGRAAHWKYKEQTANAEESAEKWLANIRSILENYTPGEDEMDNSTRMELFSDYVYAFTPQGDLKKLKAGATVLDFAFDIHSEIGQKCTGAKVNNLYVPLKFVLKTGDQVEIITSRSQKPNKDWLTYATTTKAITRIKRCLKDEEFSRADIGKGMLMRKLSQLKINYSDEIGNKLVSYFKAASILDLFHGIAEEKYDLQKTREALNPSPKAEDLKPVEKLFPKNEQKVSKKLTHKTLVIINENTPLADVKLSKCCMPVLGDEIFGFVTVAEGIKIHRTSCTNAPQMLSRYPYRVVSARWAQNAEVTSYIATLKITGEDRMGMLNSISDIITKDLNANIRSIHLNSNQGKFEGTISINVDSKSHLDLITARLSKLKGVKRVIREQ